VVAALGLAVESDGLWLQRATFLLVAMGGISLLALLARWSVVCELFAHFRLQYLVLQAVALVLVLAQRRFDLAVVVVIVAVPHLLAVAPYLPGTLRPAPAVPSAGDARLVALNLQFNNGDFERARDYLLGARADVLVISEFTPRAAQRLAFLEAGYPHRVFRPRNSAWGIAVYSRLPILETVDLPLDDGRSSQLRIRLGLAGGPIDLYALHLASPTGPGRAALRNSQLDRLAGIVGAARSAEPAVPAVVVGDLNLTPFSPWFGDLLRKSGLRDARQPFGLHVTWPALLLPLWIPIDHCLVSGGVDVRSVAAGPAMGSDHLPLEISLARSTP
jgi:endonuclease/exonuclease/phosphatase (EEP) superfamily protein YafD